MADALDTIAALVDRFERNFDEYTRPTYKEFRLRAEFIDKMFEVLGWDVSNKKGHAEAYKDVVLEDSLLVDESRKAPDYAFRIGGVRKFFVEAKAPSVNILSDSKPAFQLRRYGWSAKTPLSVLTNFTNLCVYDCRIKPENGDSSSRARLLKFHYKEYVARWDELKDIFSQEAILLGNFDRYASDKTKRGGTAEVDDAFLAEIESWREALAKNIAARNRGISVEDLNFAVQQTIDRIIFLRIAEDRRMENYGQLRDAVAKPGAYASLLRIFHAADARYNSGLFHFSSSDGEAESADTFTPTLTIDDAPLKALARRLYYPESPYAFSVISADILGQVYEQFLGKVIRLAGRSAVVEEKPEVKKAGGVFYTPAYVTAHIVSATVGKALAGKTTAQASGQDKRIKGAAPFRVLDPACGSGSFLIEAYRYLLEWYRAQYVAEGSERHAQGKQPKIRQVRTNEWQLTIEEKKRILLEHIFGVDLDPQAVEVTKLSLLLKVLEGENSDTLASQTDMFRTRVLPDLVHNIRCGNSLVGDDIFDHFPDEGDTWTQLQALRPFEWTEFDFFAAERGFDVVIGNPPYGAAINPFEKAYHAQAFKFQSYQLDSYLLFIERIITGLMKEDGVMGLIIPNPWLTNLRQNSLRTLVLDQTHLDEITHFTFNVFKKARATVDTEVVCLTKGRSRRVNVDVHIADGVSPTGQLTLARTIVQDQRAWRSLGGEPINIFLTKEDRDLQARLRASGPRLDSRFHVSIGFKPYQAGKGKPAQTKADVEGRVFDAATRVDPTYRQYLRGGDITRFQISPLESRFIKYGDMLAEPRPGANFDAAVKVFVRQTGDRLIAAVDTQQFIGMNNMHVVTSKTADEDEFYALAAILNSRLMNWYFRSLNPEAGEALAEVKKEHVAQLPIPTLSAKNAAQLKSLAGHARAIEVAMGRQSTARSSQEKTELRREVDRRLKSIEKDVARLYALDPSTEKFIEQSSAIA